MSVGNVPVAVEKPVSGATRTWLSLVGAKLLGSTDNPYGFSSTGELCTLAIPLFSFRSNLSSFSDT
ncbi:hypothetical protein DPMN_143932 [Dreissena polymorpha]|uniref:Uncharacterized protein n=1 Tax=Dreissena polymorpha TaxID=45954 RepID=A0A9D4GDY9_DREPO|nr:hypothetical protein DPMN_143932 [Dreissena polymorpha]